MTWLRVDDNLAYHPKVLAAGTPAMGLWVRAGAWSAHQLTDGMVPPDIVKTMDLEGDPCPTCGQGGPLAPALVRAGLWVKEPGGYRFHQWDERQPTRAAVEAQRDADRKRKQEWREARRRAREGADW